MDYELLTTIVQQAQNGEKGALEQLYHETYNRVYFYAYKIFGNENDAADVVQEVYVKVFTHLSELKDARAFHKWLYTIAVNECKQKMRRDSRHILTEEGDAFFEQIIDLDPDLDANRRLIYKDARTFILAVIDYLPEEQRRAVLLYFYEQLTIHQIAEIEEVSESTIKSRLMIARKKIKAAVEAEERRTGTRLLVAGLPALAAVLAEGAQLVTMPSNLAAHALTVALAAVGFIDGDAAVTYISTNETEEDETPLKKLNRGIIVELNPRKIFFLLFVLIVIALSGLLVVMSSTGSAGAIDLGTTSGVSGDLGAENGESSDSAAGGGVASQDNVGDTEPDGLTSSTFGDAAGTAGAGDGAEAGDAVSVRDENAPIGSQLNPLALELGISIGEIPQVGDKLWMEYTPQSTGYYCFDAYFDGKFHGKNAELTTWAGTASYGSTLFKGACTVGMGKKSVAGKTLQEHYLYFTNDSILEAGVRYTICLEFEKGIAPEKLLLIQADMPF